MKTYKGSCHCQAVRFEIDADIDRVRVCDCSVCRKRGALIFRVAPKHFRLLTPLENLSVYKWGTGIATDYFCPTCGILPFRKPSMPTPEEWARGLRPFEGWAVNVRCLDGVNYQSLPVERVSGSELKI